MNNQPIVHIGYPKAASTTLQCNLFFEHSEINYLSINGPTHKENFQIDENIRKLHQELITLNGIEYHYSNTRNFFNDVIKKYMSSEKRNLFSSEALLNQNFVDNYLKAYRLKEIFPNAKIIIVLRNQVDLLRSIYDMRCGGGRYIAFDKWLEMELKHFNTNFSGGLKFYETVAFYQELFGKHNVEVLLFEELLESINSFAHKLSAFIDIDAEQTNNLLKNKPLNTAKSHQVHNLRVKLNFIPGIQLIQFSKVLPKSTHKYLVNKLTEVLPSKKSVMSQYHVDKMQETYGLSNRKLMDEFGLDVARYNYPLI
jgi:hypothetical protein